MTIVDMTSSEIGVLWSQYIQNSMSLHMMKYFNEIVEDKEIRTIVEKTLRFTLNVNTEIEHLFHNERIPTPEGFTDKDVNIHAPRLYTDSFILSFLEMFGKAGTVAYCLSQSASSRHDIRKFFTDCLLNVSNLYNLSVDLGLEKGLYVRPPYMTKPKNADYIEGKAYFTKGFNPFTKRTLNSIEIMHLFENFKTNQIGSFICTSFAQTTETKEIKKFFVNGKKIGTKHVKIFSNKLAESNIEPPSSSDHGVTESTTRVFSDKLMMFLKTVLTASGQGNYSAASTASMRYDLVADYQRLSAEVALYAKDGLDIMLKHHWLEEPPQYPDRSKLINQ
ncbi:DUF3231 family protein [Halalkalibacter krulwichiae]|uniref:DUF3231 family protein n=1 Tax=Halalkalibacter krulwichiae TaxID=199441 RepID=A0A1X9MIU4_9BACI|nr:DUF3231 family protein [Halalkalibacter krulwichiae]ARK30532.1 hypothetical protein BkAM31D_12210 [Halalkalibacter krulwichiae]